MTISPTDAIRDPGMFDERRIRVLVVDDSPDVAEMLVRLLGRERDLESAGALIAADEIVDEVARREVDVVILDLTMPGRPPLEACRALVERSRSCRVIAYSGYDDPATRERARCAGASELVSKNTEPGEVISAIRRVATSGP